MSGLFEAHTAQKNPEIRQVFPDFSVLSGQKNSRSKLLCTQKEIFLCRARRKAQEYWICIPSILNEARREKILFALPHPCVNAPKTLPLLFYFLPVFFFFFFRPLRRKAQARRHSTNTPPASRPTHSLRSLLSPVMTPRRLSSETEKIASALPS